MAGFVVTLPFPPTVNNLFANTPNGRVRTAKYRAWAKAALTHCRGARRIAGPYRLTVLATRPDSRKRDLSNLLKATEDLLVKAGLVQDDSLCTDIQLSWLIGPPVAGGAVMVTAEAA
jgi:Holliday junction resolvase RusA-like endonuclease